MAEEKILKDEALKDDELDEVAGGAELSRILRPIPTNRRRKAAGTNRPAAVINNSLTGMYLPASEESIKSVKHKLKKSFGKSRRIF